MTTETLFGTEKSPCKTRTIRFKQITAIYETITVREDITNYLKPGTRYNARYR